MIGALYSVIAALGDVLGGMLVIGPLSRGDRDPRTRKLLLDHARYYEYREELLSFLEEHEHQRTSRAA